MGKLFLLPILFLLGGCDRGVDIPAPNKFCSKTYEDTDKYGRRYTLCMQYDYECPPNFKLKMISERLYCEFK